MHWEDVDRKFPALPWPTSGGDAIALAKREIDAALTHLARAALGLAVKPIESLAATVRDTWQTRVVMRGHAIVELDAGALAMIATHEHAWDLVATCTGGTMLPYRVPRKKTFAESAGLARHLATAARSRLPAADVVAAMDDVRARFAADQIDVRIAVIATRIFVRDLVAAVDVIATTRSWLAGEALELEPGEAPRAVADGEDARVTIFERYAPELSDEAAIDIQLAAVAALAVEPWERYLERQHNGYDDAIIRAFVARRPLPDGWQDRVDPVVASWLGVEPTPAIARRLADLALLAGGMKLDRGWEEPIKVLAFGSPERVPALTGGGTPPDFVRGGFFKDDGRKLLRYLATAIIAGATPSDVEPAWLDFLARRSPATTPMLERSALRWWHLLAIQSAITHRIGHAPRESAGRALQRIVTGV